MFKGIFYTKWKFCHYQLVPNLDDFLSSLEHKLIFKKNVLAFYFYFLSIFLDPLDFHCIDKNLEMYTHLEWLEFLGEPSIKNDSILTKSYCMASEELYGVFLELDCHCH